MFCVKETELAAAVLMVGRQTVVLHALQMIRVERTSGTTLGYCSVDSVLRQRRTFLLVVRFWSAMVGIIGE